MTDNSTTPNIPQGITFGRKVLVMPGIGSGFTHSGDIKENLQGRNYHWIQRGAPVAEFYIDGSHAGNSLIRAFTSKTYTAAIRAPVSGMILHSTVGTSLNSDVSDLSRQSHPPLAQFSILLPDDEPPAEGGEYIFGDVCRLIRDFQHYFLKPSRYWSMGPFTSDELGKLLTSQQRSACGVFDALPFWADYLNEARTKYPHLRPYLKHIQ